MKFTQEMQNLAMVTLITLSVWAGISIYNAFVTPATPEIYQELIKPLDPALDIDLLNNLKNRTDYTDIVASLEVPTFIDQNTNDGFEDINQQFDQITPTQF